MTNWTTVNARNTVVVSFVVALVGLSNAMQQCELREHRKQIRELQQQRCRP